MTFSGKTDGELLALFAANGNQDAMEEIIRRHAAMVLTVCRRASRQGRDCEDMMQLVFVTLARKATTLQGYASLAGWLHRVAWYTARRACRASTIRRFHEQKAAEICMQIRQENADREQMREEVHRILELLPDQYREPLILHHVEGHTVEEAAHLMNLKVGTVASRLSRGRKMLQDRLEEKGFIFGSATGLTLLLADENSPATVPVGPSGAAVTLPPGTMAGIAVAGESAVGITAMAHAASLQPLSSYSSMFAGGVRPRYAPDACNGAGAACIPLHSPAGLVLAICGIASRHAVRIAVAAGLLVAVGGAAGAVHHMSFAGLGTQSALVQSEESPLDFGPFDSSGESVPEPGTLTIVAGAAILLIRRRGR